jgi:hypothetical protein
MMSPTKAFPSRFLWLLWRSAIFTIQAVIPERKRPYILTRLGYFFGLSHGIVIHEFLNILLHEQGETKLIAQIKRNQTYLDGRLMD